MGNNKDINIKLPHFISNRPSGSDLYEGKSQEKLSQAIADYISSVDDEKNPSQISRILGLEGYWGAGKSNVIKQLKSILINTYYIFEYDAWGHQEDLQRRSFLETLTQELTANNFLVGKVAQNDYEKSISWDEKLKNLLAHKIIRTNKTLPKFNAGAFWTALFLSLTPISTFIAERLESNCAINNIWTITLIAFGPIILGILVWGILCIINKDARHLGFLLKISKDENIETTNYETINEDEPSVSKFKSWMSDISKYIGENISRENSSAKRLIIVFDNMDRLPAEKVKELWSSIHTFFTEDNFENIWVIIPFDEKHLACAFGENKNESKDEEKSFKLTKYFINKTFPIVYRVAPPVITDFKFVFNEYFKVAFENEKPNDRDEVNRIFRFERPDATVREIITFINELLVLKMIWREEIRLLHMAIFILKRDSLLKDPVNQILSGAYLDNNLMKIVTNNEDLQKHLSALIYGISPDEAEQIPLSKYIDNCIKNESGYDINQYRKSNRHFIDILNDKMRDTDDGELDIAINALSLLKKNDFQELETEAINQIWQYFSQRKMKEEITDLIFEPSMQNLLKNTARQEQEDIVRHLCLGYQNTHDSQPLDGKKYYTVLQHLESFLSAEKIEVALELSDLTVTPDVFIDYVYEAKNKYLEYKLKTESDKLDRHFANLVPDKISGSKISVVKYLIKDVSYKFTELKASIESVIKNNEITENNFGELITIYKTISESNDLLSQQLSDQSQSTLWAALSTKPDDPGYCDLIAMQISKNIKLSITLNDGQLKDVSENMDYYADYGDLLVSGQDIVILNHILKYMTENSLGRRLLIENVLPNFFSIIARIKVTEQVLLDQLNKWCDQKNKLKEENVVSTIPYQLYQHTAVAKNELADHINTIIIKTISAIDQNTFYSNKQNSATDYYFIAIESLIDTQYLENLPNNLKELGKLLLADIASGKFAIPANNDLFDKLIKKLAKSDTSALIKNIRNDYCNGIYPITDKLFIFFEKYFREQGNLKERADLVTSKIIQPVFLNTSCLRVILLNVDYYAEIINAAGDDATELKNLVEESLKNSQNETLEAFAKKIGITNNV
jgi:hypothetical protein